MAIQITVYLQELATTREGGGGRGAEGVELLSTTSRLALCEEGERAMKRKAGKAVVRGGARAHTPTQSIYYALCCCTPHSLPQPQAGRQAGKLFLGLSTPSVGNFHRPFYIVL